MLNNRESDIVRAALRASVEGPFFSDVEFHTLMGVERDEMRGVLEAWPKVIDSEVADLAINNALNNLIGYPHGEWDAWARYSDADPDELAHVFMRWRSERGMSRPSTHFEGMS
jgi:hypothetical protein